jgi:regulator of nonsense transcripts 2
MAEELSEQEFEAQLEALGHIEALKKERDEFNAFRDSNSGAALAEARRDHESSKSSLKSDLKKTTAFVKKIKAITTEGLQQCIRDTEILNLNLYLSEIVAAIMETNYKATDVALMVKLSICLHRRYDEFTKSLLSALRVALLPTSSVANAAPSSDEEKDSGKKKRILIRFAVELYQAGVWTDADFFSDLLRSLLGKPRGYVCVPYPYSLTMSSAKQ